MWPDEIGLAYDEGADGLEIVQSGRERESRFVVVVRGMGVWMDEGRRLPDAGAPPSSSPPPYSSWY